MHLLPVPNLLIRMNLFFAQVQADLHSAEQNNPVNCFVRGDGVSRVRFYAPKLTNLHS